MKVDVTELSKDKELQKWLQRFFYHVDIGRAERGLELFHKGRVKTFQDKVFGFTAVVHGSKNYNLSAFFEGFTKTGLPNLDNTLFICSCPDDVIFCKHVVAAVAKWVQQVEQGRITQSQLLHRRENNQQKISSGGGQLERLERLARQEPPPKYSIRERFLWEFKPPLDEVLNSIQRGVIQNGVLQKGVRHRELVDSGDNVDHHE